MREPLSTLTCEDLRQALLRQVAFRDIERAVLQMAHLPAAEAAAASALFLLQQTKPSYAKLLTNWVQHGDARAGVRLDTVRCVPFAPWGIAVPEFIKRFVKPTAKTIIAIDASLSEVGAALSYGLTLFYSLAVPVTVAFSDSVGCETHYRFYPGDFLPELTLYCLQSKIPLLPLSRRPHLVVSEMQFLYNRLVRSAQTEFAAAAAHARSLPALQESAAHEMKKVFGSGLHLVVEREDVISKSCYLASRLFDLAGYLDARRSQPVSLVLLYKMEHALDVPDLIAAFGKRGGVFELYQTAEQEHDGTFSLAPLLSPAEDELRTTPSRHIVKMQTNVRRFLTRRMQEHVTIEQVDHMAAEIAETLRHHPNVERPPGVRGTLAMREMAQALGLVHKRLTRQDAAAAALLAFRHRTRFKDDGVVTPEQVFKTVLSRHVFNIALDAAERQKKLGQRKPLTPDEAAQVLQGLADAALRTCAPGEALPVDDPDFAEAALQHPLIQQALQEALDKGMFETPHSAVKDLVQELEDRGYLELTDAHHATFSAEGKNRLQEKLEEALARGEITPEQLAAALNHARALPAPEGLGTEKLRLSPKAETELLAELMDYQHQSRSQSSSLEDLYVHYVVNEKKGLEVLSDKVDYEKLKVMLHHLERSGTLSLERDGKHYRLSHRALHKLLDALIQREKGQMLERRAFRREHETDKTDVRRYRRGDVFRDISIRHSVRRILRKGKGFEDINYTDLRSFEKKPRSQLDIAVCVDISESMKHSGKLRYAKLAVAELARAATEKGDRVGIVAFSNLGQVVMPLTDKITPLLEATMTLRAEQYTNIGNGLRCARRMLLKEKNSNSRYIIIITDGQPNAALSDEPEDGLSYHARIAAFSRETTMETKRALGAHHALVEAGLTRRKHIKISVIYIAEGDKEDQESERIAREIARIGNGRFHKVKAIERLPLEALETVG
ncbi:MAG: VWA domain-containing protein [Desulfobacterota bacterium]|nr:VWA domain-containing protein [Thermodesulfobacteriota bacterium]